MYSRIMIFGRPGSGKSTCALQLHESIGLPLYHLDKHFYEKNWVERDYQEFMAIQHQIVARDRWIIDGNNTKSLEFRYARAHVCVYFNYPRLTCLWRILKRKLVSKNINIHDRAEGCFENMRWSLIKYTWTFEKRVEKIIGDLRMCYPQVIFLEITCDNDLLDLYNFFEVVD